MATADRGFPAEGSEESALPARLRALAGTGAAPGSRASRSNAEPASDGTGEESEPESDEHLALRARDGDRLAFARLYERYARTVHGVLLAGVPRQDAGDLVQEVFLLALRAISRLEDAKRVGPWLLTIARNRGRDAHKSKRHVVALAEVEEIAQGTDAGHGEARLEEEQEAERALDTVRGLPDAYRETLILRLVEGLSGPEIAERTGMTHGSVRVNLHRGMKILRERLAQAGGR